MPAKSAGSGVKFAEGDEQDADAAAAAAHDDNDDDNNNSSNSKSAAASAGGEESKGGEGKQGDGREKRASTASIAAQLALEEVRNRAGSRTSLASLVDAGRKRSIRDSIAGFLSRRSRATRMLLMAAMHLPARLLAQPCGQPTRPLSTMACSSSSSNMGV